MKVKAVLVGMGLLMFILCSVSLSQAEMHPKHKMRFMAPPNEHPWQESGSPSFDDSIGPDDDSPTVIVIGPVKFILIKLTFAKSVQRGNQQVGDLQMGSILNKGAILKNKDSR